MLTAALSFNTCTFFRQNMTSQSSSQNLPTDKREILVNPGSTCACWAVDDSFVDNGNCAILSEVMVAAFGKTTVGPLLVGLTDVAQRLSFGRR